MDPFADLPAVAPLEGLTMSPLPLAAAPSKTRRSGARIGLAREGGVVIAIAAALAATAVPTRGTSLDPRTAAMVGEARAGLVELRGAIDDFRRDHGRWPGADRGAASVDALGEDLLGGDHPYLAEVPRNPVSGERAVRVVFRGGAPPGNVAAVADAGWLYDAGRGRIWLATPGRIQGMSDPIGREETRWVDL